MATIAPIEFDPCMHRPCPYRATWSVYTREIIWDGDYCKRHAEQERRKREREEAADAD